MSTSRAPTDGDDVEEGLLSGIQKAPSSSLRMKRMLKRMLPVTILIGVTVALISPSTHRNATLDIPEDVQQDWAQYSPYIPQEEYHLPPSSCKITQANILQRHGARYPSSGATERIVAALSKLLSADHYEDPRFKFLETFTYDLGSDDLVSFGADQSFASGKEAFVRYSSLVDMNNLPFVRASSAERVVLSATNWTSGFAAASDQMFQPKLTVILSEGNDTLDDKMCPSAGASDSQADIWLAQYAPPITNHLNAAAPGANLSDADTHNLISLCPFETVAKQSKSAFCDVFEDEDGAFEGFAYAGDLDKFYGTGYGQPLGPVQGVGYVNELLARLTSQPVRDRTQTNRTLDSSPETFPLNRPIYADFSHDNTMIAIFAAIGLFRQPALDPARPDAGRTWRVGEMVPFSGRMVVERLQCEGILDGTDGAEGGGLIDAVRILVNDRVQPLEFCGANEDGVCSLEAFVDSQEYARNNGNGDWEKCFET